MTDYWETARSALSGLPGGGINIAHEAVDRHVDDGLGSSVAIRWISTSGETTDLTYRELSQRTNRFARALHTLGYHGGHAVATLCGRVPQLYEAALGTLKGGGIYAPLFSAFGTDPVVLRLQIGRVDVLVTTTAMYRRKVQKRRPELPDLGHVLLLDGDGAEFDDPTVLGLAALMEAASDATSTVPSRTPRTGRTDRLVRREIARPATISNGQRT